MFLILLCIFAIDGKVIKPSTKFHKKTMNREEAIAAARAFINEHKPAEPQVNYTERVLNAVQTHYNSIPNDNPKKQLMAYVMGNMTQSAISNPVHFEKVAKASAASFNSNTDNFLGVNGNKFDFLKILKEKEGLKEDLHNKMMGEVKKRRQIAKK